MRPRAGDRVRLRATDLDLEGRGVGALGDHEVHVGDLLPGEEAEVEIRHVSRQARRAFGERLGPPPVVAPERTARLCAGARCGGCAWQHLSYPAQLAHKRRRVERALAAALPAPPPVAAPVPSPQQAGTRNKATYVLAAGAGGAVRLGAYAPRSHDWIDTAGCRIVAPAIGAAVPAIASALTATGLPVHDERTREGALRYVVVRASRAGDVLVGVVTTSDADRAPLERAAGDLVGQAGIRGVVQVQNDATSGAILGDRVVPLAGAPTIAETVSGVAIDVGIDTFLQIHLDQAEALYQRLADRALAMPVTAPVTAPVQAIDLYCGVGAIAFALARRGARVLGIERNPAAIAAARAAADRAGLADRIGFQAAPADEAALPSADLVVVNPPRQGLTPQVRAHLLTAAPDTLAYVSCGPDSLARDLAELTTTFRIDSVEPFDLMPGTGHIETLVLLTRR